MPDPLPVHLSVPLRRIPGPDGLTLATDLQGSEAEVDACVYAAVNTPLGWRVDLPEFGRPGQTFRRGGANLAEIERTIAMWEPRADLEALRQSGRLADLMNGLDVISIAEPED
jgi:phage baseplate assembly protein W